MKALDLPYFIDGFAGVGGRIKDRPEDFFVQEIPLYEPTNDGDHVMAEIQKIGLSTFDALDCLGRELNVSPRDIGYAGMKDTWAVTRQIVTIPRTTPEAVMAVKTDKLSVNWAAPHRNKLRLGHLKANRFAIKIRDVEPTKVVLLRPVLDVLARRGMPNFFGDQRFGRRNNNDLLGAAFVRGDDKEVLRLMLGDPRPDENPNELEARQHFNNGDYERALRAWPYHSGSERRVLGRLVKTADVYQAVQAADMSVRRLWVSAMQSRIFNEVVQRRITQIDKLLPGDLAYKHDNGACFSVETPGPLQARVEAFEISATGPLIGRRLAAPSGVVLEMERELFEKYDVSPNDFRTNQRDRSHGDRRPIRVQPQDVQLEGGVDDHGAFITVAFTLPPGAYATILMREIMRPTASAVATPEEPVDIPEHPEN